MKHDYMATVECSSVTYPPPRAEIKPIANFTWGILMQWKAKSSKVSALTLWQNVASELLVAMVFALLPSSLHAAMRQTGELTYYKYKNEVGYS